VKFDNPRAASTLPYPQHDSFSRGRFLPSPGGYASHVQHGYSIAIAISIDTATAGARFGGLALTLTPTPFYISISISIDISIAPHDVFSRGRFLPSPGGYASHVQHHSISLYLSL